MRNKLIVAVVGVAFAQAPLAKAEHRRRMVSTATHVCRASEYYEKKP
jgi:hypothetical protein